MWLDIFYSCEVWCCGGSPGQPGDISHHITTQIPQISQSIWCKLIFSRHNTARSPAQRGTESPPTWHWTPSIISLPIITHCSEGGEEFWVANNNSSISFCKVIWLDSIQYNVWNIFNMVGFKIVHYLKNLQNRGKWLDFSVKNK